MHHQQFNTKMFHAKILSTAKPTYNQVVIHESNKVQLHQHSTLNKTEAYHQHNIYCHVKPVGLGTLSTIRLRPLNTFIWSDFIGIFDPWIDIYQLNLSSERTTNILSKQFLWCLNVRIFNWGLTWWFYQIAFAMFVVCWKF